ncbi:MAG: cell division protein ZapA [Gammaproteobacteria bacterium]|nr:cell division protein ZapA [Gammaproteobacteria bacterium]
MTSAAKPLTLTIMDKDYLVGCVENEREALLASVEFLNGKLREQRDSGKVIGSERVAVMAALNIAHEYLDYRSTHTAATTGLGEGLNRIQQKIDAALARGATPPPPRPSTNSN